MKKAFILISLIAIVFIANAQTAKIAGSWLMTKAEIDGEIQEPNFITDLKENGDMVIMGMDAGTWEFNKKKNSIDMTSELDKDFNGESEILKLTEKEMVLLKGAAKLYYIRVNLEQILKDNKASGLEGSWKIQGGDNGLIAIFHFELPDIFTLIEEEEGMHSKTSGTWMFDAQNKSLLIVSMENILRGTNKIIKHNTNKLELENNGARILALKEDKKTHKIERLNFTGEDFFTEDGDFKYYDDEQKLPWQDSYTMVTSLVNVKHLVYKYSTLIEDTEAFKDKILTANVMANVEEQNLSIDYIFYGYDTYNLPEDTQLPPNSNYTELLFPEKDASFRVTGTEKITTPAGTFDCTVLEAIGDFDLLKKLWMINDKPGIYAKIIADEPGEWGHYSVYELQGIE